MTLRRMRSMRSITFKGESLPRELERPLSRLECSAGPFEAFLKTMLHSCVLMMIDEPVEDEEDLANDRWVRENFMSLVQSHPTQWIAVMDKRVICSDMTDNETESKAKEIVGERRFSLYFIPPTPTWTDVRYGH